MSTHTMTLYVSSYANESEQGIQTFLLDRSTGTLTHQSGLSGIENPSFLTLDLSNNRGYAVSEKEDGELVSIEINGASLNQLNAVRTHGSSPCYVEKKGNYLFTVNYMGGNITAYPILEEGRVGEAVDIIQYEGSSVQSDRQEASHPHTLVKDPQSQYLFVTNLGTDHLHLLKFNENEQSFEAVQTLQMTPGMGPRHIAFHPTLPYVYVSGELDSTVAVFHWERDKAQLTLTEQVTTLPEDFNEENTVAEINVSPSGHVLYCSNRGHDSLAVYSIDPSGQLNLIQHAETGQGPRHFAILPTEDWVVVANQFSDNLFLYKVQPDGRLERKQQDVQMNSPVCIQVDPREMKK